MFAQSPLLGNYANSEAHCSTPQQIIGFVSSEFYMESYIHTCAKVLSPEPDLISFIKLHATTAAATAYDEVSLRLLEVS